MAELDKFGDDRVNKIREIMLDGLIHTMDQDDDLFDTESIYDPESNTVRVRFGIHGIISPPEFYQKTFHIEKPPSMFPKLKTLKYEHSGELAPNILVRHNFHLESTAKCVLHDIKMMLEKYGSYTMSDWKDTIDGIQEMSDFGYILDDTEELVVLQGVEGFYIYPMIFKPINTKVSPASQAAMDI